MAKVFLFLSLILASSCNLPTESGVSTTNTATETSGTGFRARYVTRPGTCVEVEATISSPVFTDCEVVDPPVIRSFGPNPQSQTFIVGQEINFRWYTENAISIKLSQIDVSAFTNYNLRFYDPAPKTITLVATNQAGTSVSTSVTLTGTTSTPSPTPVPTPTPIPTPSNTKVLSGEYIPEFYPNCAPAQDTDYMKDILGARIEPGDCVKVPVANPVFAWAYPSNMPEANQFLFTLRSSSNVEIYKTSTSLPRLLLPSTISLTAGSYKWAVSYKNTSGTWVNSQERRFTIPSSNQYKIPDANEIKQRVLSRSHPRILPQGASFTGLRSLIQTSPYAGLFSNGFASETQRLFSKGPNSEYPNIPKSAFPSENDYNQRMIDIKRAAEEEQVAIESLSLYGSVMQRQDYLDQARARVLKLSTYDLSGSTSEVNQDQANRAILLALAYGIEFHYNSFTSTQRSDILNSLRIRLTQVMDKFKNFDRQPKESHLLTATHYALQALMHVTGYEGFEPEPGTLLMKAWDAFITMSGAWRGGQDGAFGNGTSYGWYALGSIARSAAAIRLMADVDVTKFPAIGNIGYNMIAQTPPGATLWGQFGDELEANRSYMNYSHDAMRLLAFVSGNNDYDWYWRMYDPNRSVTVHFISPFHFLMLNLKPAPTSSATPAYRSNYIFEDAGYAALHSNTARPDRSSLFFRSSKLGSFNHSHADNNAFTFVSKGKEMFISGGYYDWYMSPHHKLITRATRFKNALTVDGGIGQAEKSYSPIAPGEPAHVAEASGKIVNFFEDGSWTHITGDATLAYRGFVNNIFRPYLTAAYRSISYNKDEGIVVIYDYAKSDIHRTFELNFQTWKALVPNGTNKFRVINEPVEVCMNYYGPQSTWSFTNGFPVAPSKTWTNQHQSRVRTASKLNAFASITVIKENCSSQDPSIVWNGEASTVTIGTKVITYNGKTITLLMQN